ncbi:serine/threonine-protein phosphatase [Thraustotheca clavata]|uniref:Serine/threonine-protein phosphatase n=1 Tax=Thraustotheca clavata TaxID=74557 RepID=A0A1W0A4M2_9STRA|nr:serine/threonine-protein phosphatase [Thraustotheca clavata]
MKLKAKLTPFSSIVRYVSTGRNALIGLELEHAVGTCDGICQQDGQQHFNCAPFHGIYVRETYVTPYSKENAAACMIQCFWKRHRERTHFTSIVLSSMWNMLDNNQEQLQMKRAEKIKSASQALSILARQNSKGPRLSHSVSSVTEDYRGPRLHFPLRLSNVLDMLEQFKKGTILHSKYVMEVLADAKKFFNQLPTLQEITVNEGEKLTVVGDLHGQLKDLFTIFTTNGLPSNKNKYLFNGDFVDRGLYGTEVVMTILCFRSLYPESVFLNRGNHESRNQNSWMGFEEEIWEKYDGTNEGDPARASVVYNMFQTFFDTLPLCALVLKKIFVVHGGLFSCDNVTLAHIKAISRKREPPLHQQGFEDKIYEDMLWSDPRAIAGRQPSERGAGTEFGHEVTNNFCAVNRVALVIRSHECVPEGYEVLHGGRLITLFSASRYCGTQLNKGAFLTLGADLQPEIQQFYGNPMTEAEWEKPEEEQVKLQENLEGDAMRMIAERICDHKADLFWYFTQHDQESNGRVPRLVWAEALKSVLALDLPFLLCQTKLTDADADNLINYSRFLSRYRIENPTVDSSGWQESIISTICKKLYRAMGAGSIEHAFRIFDADKNGTIEYDEFMSTLKQMDTGLSEHQVFELMRTADTNDDGRIDFKEFVQRFEVIFTDIRNQPSDKGSFVQSSPPPPPFNAPSKLQRRTSERETPIGPVPMENVDPETMSALLQIGKAFFQLDGSLLDNFHRFDTNRDGVLQTEEFFSAIKQLGLTFSDALLDKIMKAVDLDGGNTIDYKEFLAAFSVKDNSENEVLAKGELTWQQTILQQVSNVFYQHRIHIRSAFRLFDQDNSGSISREEFRAGISTFNAILEMPLSEDQIEALLTMSTTGYGISGHKNSFSSTVKIGNYVEDQFGAALAKSSIECSQLGLSEVQANFSDPQSKPPPEDKRSIHHETEQYVARTGLSYSLLFPHGMAGCEGSSTDWCTTNQLLHGSQRIPSKKVFENGSSIGPHSIDSSQRNLKSIELQKKLAREKRLEQSYVTATQANSALVRKK